MCRVIPFSLTKFSASVSNYPFLLLLLLTETISLHHFGSHRYSNENRQGRQNFYYTQKGVLTFSLSHLDSTTAPAYYSFTHQLRKPLYKLAIIPGESQKCSQLVQIYWLWPGLNSRIFSESVEIASHDITCYMTKVLNPVLKNLDRNEFIFTFHP